MAGVDQREVNEPVLSYLKLKPVAAAIVFVAFGCGGGGPTEDQLENLRETKAAALSAEKKVEGLKTESRRLEETVAEKRGELSEAEAEKEAIATKLEEMGRVIESQAEETPVDTSAGTEPEEPPGL